METPHGALKPASLHMIVTRAFRNTGIIINPGRRHGPHALRASLATAMLNENVPLPVISETLSHSTTDATRIYLKVDIPNLRRLALEVPGLEGIWMGGAR
jgi:site-specific recombinase XerD